MYYRLHANNSYGQQYNETEEWHCIAEKINYVVLKNYFYYHAFYEKNCALFEFSGRNSFFNADLICCISLEVKSSHPLKICLNERNTLSFRKDLQNVFLRWNTIFNGVALIAVRLENN
jgi:hypothetical protein